MKNGSIGTLLVVALVALAMMTFIGYDSSSSGAFSAPRAGPRPSMGPGPAGPGPAGPGAAIRPPIRVVDRDVTVVDSDEEPVYYTDTSSTSVNDCVIAREVKAVKDKLQMPMSDDLVNLVSKCNQLNIY